jgi:adenine-specific DNA-methyltransferase
VSLTDYHAKFFAHELTRRCPSDSVEKLAGAVASAQVDLNPHQVDAALFAFRSPLSKGALLADEVGLGKTIEAGLVLSQKWAERKRRILVIVPSNLRKQWYQELGEKFFLPCRILESKSYNAAIREGRFRPFEVEEIVICSYQFARNKAADVANTPWDLVVLDEAHRLRNVYKPTNVIANTLKQALKDRNKLLLTATPLQNSLLELFGLVSIIDDHAFGDLKSFKEQFTNLTQEQVFETLKARLRPICHRTLRKQVTAYIPYTARHPILEHFTPDESEDRLYNAVSEYLRRPNLQALPASQRSLMTLVLRKLLASSTFAIAGALQSISSRLEAKLAKQQPTLEPLEEELAEDYEALDETAEEWEEVESEAPLSEEDRAALEAEIVDLKEFARLASSISHNAKGKALLRALDVAFAKARELGAAEKVIIFTESRRTQSYLLRLLADSSYAEGIVLFNGTNTDDRSKAIYSAWLVRHDGSDRITGSRSADMRSALVDYFREEGRIMIATEAGAEGINLQFCSLVVNYDLPWNPQRIEQRIGRCHRYGQKHDVVVVNFLNSKNAADQRVYELLDKKFQLFEGVFGASDEVLGAIESGVDFEKRIHDIYQRCRKQDEIKQEFDQLQMELELEITESMKTTRRKLLENFDDEVREKLRVQDEASKSCLNRYELLLTQLTRHELRDHAEFLDDASFRLKSSPFPGDVAAMPIPIPHGLYELPRRSGEAHLYRLGHPLAEAIILRAKNRDLPIQELHFSYSDHEGRISSLEPYRGISGWMTASLLNVDTHDQGEDHLLVAAQTDQRSSLEPEVAARLLSLPGEIKGVIKDQHAPPETLPLILQSVQEGVLHEISERNNTFFEEEVEKLDAWTEDLKKGLEREIKEMDALIKEARREARAGVNLEAKLAAHQKVHELEQKRTQKRRDLFEEQDRLDQEREKLIAEVGQRLQPKISSIQLFTIRWHLT